MVVMLNEIGVKEIADLKGKDPLKLYEATCEKRAERMDPCVLYTYRCAVYVAETAQDNNSRVTQMVELERQGT